MAWHGWIKTNNGKNFGFISPWIRDADNNSCVHFDKTSLNNQSVDISNLGIGTCVTFNVVNDDQPHPHATNVKVITAFVIPSTMIGKACQLQFTSTLLENGPLSIKSLLENTQKKDNCLEILKKVKIDAVKAFLTNCNSFRLVDDQVLLPDLNEKLCSILEAQHYCTLGKINGLFSNNHALRNYLYGKEGWHNGVKNFTAKNCDLFYFWNHAVYSTKKFKELPVGQLNAIRGDMAALFYFAKFVIHKGPLKIKSLKGHIAQGIGIPGLINTSFSDFLNRNCFFFKITSSCACKDNRHIEFDDLNFEIDVHMNRLRGILAFLPFSMGDNSYQRDELAHFYYNLLEKYDNQTVQWLTGYYSQESNPPRKYLPNGKMDTLLDFLSTYPFKFNVKKNEDFSACSPQVSTIKPKSSDYDQSFYGEMASQTRLIFARVSQPAEEITNRSSSSKAEQKPSPRRRTRNHPRKKGNNSSDLSRKVEDENKLTSPTLNSKAFTGRQYVNECGKVETSNHVEKFPMQCSDSVVESLQELSLQDNSSSAVAAGPSQDICSSVFPSSEGQLLNSLFGFKMFQALNNFSSSQNVGLDNLICLRMNIGRKPSLKLFQGVSETLMVILEECEIIKRGDLENILSKSSLSRITAGLYGIKGTLHTIRTSGRPDQINSISLFFENQGLAFEDNLHILKRRRLTAVFTDDEKLPAKLSRNCIRRLCKDLAEKLNDVIVIDFNKKLSGFEVTPHESVGHASVIPYYDASELADLVSNAIDNMHDYIVITAVDSQLALNSIELACKKGKRVIAEISMEMKHALTGMFPE